MHTVSDARKRTSENEGLKPEPTSDYVRDLCRRKLLLEQEVEQLRAVNETLRKVIKRLDDKASPLADQPGRAEWTSDRSYNIYDEPLDVTAKEWPLDEHGRFRVDR